MGAPTSPGPEERGPRPAEALRGRIQRIAEANTARHEELLRIDRHIAFEQALVRQRRALLRALGKVMPAGVIDALDPADMHGEGWRVGVSGLEERARARLHMSCRGCDYSLRGLPPTGRCPECGRAYRTGAIGMEELRRLIADALSLTLPEIDPQRTIDQLARASVAQQAPDPSP